MDSLSRPSASLPRPSLFLPSASSSTSPSLSLSPCFFFSSFLSVSYEREGNSSLARAGNTPLFFSSRAEPSPLSTLLDGMGRAIAIATLSARLRPFSTCIFIRCVNNYRGHKTWYTADADLYIAHRDRCTLSRMVGRPTGRPTAAASRIYRSFLWTLLQRGTTVRARQDWFDFPAYGVVRQLSSIVHRVALPLLPLYRFMLADLVFFLYSPFATLLLNLYCLFTVYCLLSTIYYLLSTVYCLLFTICHLLSTVLYW